MVINSIRMFLDQKNLLHNIEYLKKVKNKDILPVVKANAYGHGVNVIVPALYSAGQREFAVARYVEAENILKLNLGNDIRILVFESIGDMELIKNTPNIDIAINSMTELKEAIEAGIDSKRMQIKIDFGFGRNGVLHYEVSELKDYIIKNNLYLGGIFTHLFAVNYRDGLKIIEDFTEIVNSIGRERFEKIHLQNSAAVMNYNCEIATHLRVGMLIYGLQEVGYYDPNLKQVFSLEGQIAGVREVENSKYVAYELKSDLDIPDCKYIAKVKIGYGDGFLKKNEKSKCIINNKEFKIAEVTMDNTFIEVDESVKEGDKIYLYRDITKEVNFIGMNIYELLTILSPRIPRVLK